MATVPAWWLQGATQINPLDQTWSAAGTQSDMFGMNNYNQALSQFIGDKWTGGATDDSSQGGFRAQDVQDWLAANGYQMFAQQGVGAGGGADTYQNMNWIQDAQGNFVGDPTYNRDDPNGVMKALALVAAGYFGGSALAGAGEGAAAGGAAATGGADAATSAAWANGAGLGMDTVSAVGGGSAAAGSLAPLAGIEGMGVTVPETYAGTATLAESGALSPELQAIAAGGSMAGGTVPAGYGAYTGATTGAGGLLGDAAQWAANNPKLVGAVVGGLAGSGGGGSSSGGSGGGGSSGPAPTITRGNWSPSATPTYMQAPNFGWNAPTTGNANSGLWQFGGGQSQSLMPQTQSLLPQPQAQSLLGPANQTQQQMPNSNLLGLASSYFGGNSLGNAANTQYKGDINGVSSSQEFMRPTSQYNPSMGPVGEWGAPTPGLLGPANQTQWQQPTGPTFNMNGQQLNQGSAMTQPTQPTQQAQPEPAGTPWAGTGGAPAAANYTWGGDGERQLAYNKGQDMLPSGVKSAADANAQGWFQARDAADGQWVWTKAGQMKAYDTTGMQMQSNGYGTLIPKHSANVNGYTGAPMPTQGLLGIATTQDRYNPNNKV